MLIDGGGGEFLDLELVVKEIPQLLGGQVQRSTAVKLPRLGHHADIAGTSALRKPPQLKPLDVVPAQASHTLLLWKKSME